MPVTHDPLPDDELVSAVLDGEATSDEVARVAGSPRLTARLAEFEVVARAVATPVVGLDDAEVDRVLRLAATAGVSDMGSDHAAAIDSTGGVADLSDRRRPRPTAGRWFAVAAAVLAVVAVPVVLQRAGDDGPQQFAAVGSAVDHASVAGESSKSSDGAGMADDAATRAGGDSASSGGQAAAAPGVVADESVELDLEEAATSTTATRPASDDPLGNAGYYDVMWLGDLGEVVDGPALAPELAARTLAVLPSGFGGSDDAPEDQLPSPDGRQVLAAELSCVRSHVGNGRVVAVGMATVRSDTAVMSVLVAVVHPAVPDDGAPLRAVVVAWSDVPEWCSLLDEAPLTGN